MDIKISLTYGDGLLLEQVLRDRAKECREYADRFPSSARAFTGSALAYEAMADRFQTACEECE